MPLARARKASRSTSSGFSRRGRLAAEGLDLPTKASGYLLYRRANLDKESEAKLTIWLQGDFSLDAVLLNLRKLGRVAVESKREWPEEEEGEDYFPTFEPELEGASAEDGEVIEEDDLIDILASYQDVRRALRQNRNARAWILSSGKSRLKGQGGSRQRQLFWTGSPPKGERRRKAGQEQGHHRTHKMPALWQDRTLVERMPGQHCFPPTELFGKLVGGSFYHVIAWHVLL